MMNFSGVAENAFASIFRPFAVEVLHYRDDSATHSIIGSPSVRSSLADLT